MSKVIISVTAATKKILASNVSKTVQDIINSFDVLMGDIELVGTRSKEADAKLSDAYDLLVKAKDLTKYAMQLEAKAKAKSKK